MTKKVIAVVESEQEAKLLFALNNRCVEVDRLKTVNAELLEALQKVVDANKEFRATLPVDWEWESDPVNDACIEARAAIAKATGKNND